MMETEMSASEISINQETLALDLICGAEAIAAEIARPKRAAYHLLETGRLPAKVIGGKWVASRSGLRRWFAQELGGAR
jgi:hypothetical protein